jgi:hypothetical protein
MKIGILGCGYDCNKDLNTRLEPWFESAKNNDFIFSFVSCPFDHFNLSNNQNTINALNDLKDKNLIQYLYTSDSQFSEAESRNHALKFLLEQHVDYIWLLDLSDEYYTVDNINKIVNFIKNNYLYDWFSINFKNYIFDGKEWIDDFCPPRIFKNSSQRKIKHFYWDNDLIYEINGYNLDYKSLSESKIPKSIAHIKHMTWLHTNGKNKYEYQMKHFGDTSYKWNYETEKLELNEDYYRKRSIPLPLIHKDYD